MNILNFVALVGAALLVAGISFLATSNVILSILIFLAIVYLWRHRSEED